MKQIPHPEIQTGEQFMLNVTEAEFRQWEAQKGKIGMEYVRLGNRAYQTDSLTPVPAELNLRPMFGKRQTKEQDATA